MLPWVGRNKQQNRIMNECVREKVGIIALIDKRTIKSFFRRFGHERKGLPAKRVY